MDSHIDLPSKVVSAIVNLEDNCRWKANSLDQFEKAIDILVEEGYDLNAPIILHPKATSKIIWYRDERLAKLGPINLATYACVSWNVLLKKFVLERGLRPDKNKIEMYCKGLPSAYFNCDKLRQQLIDTAKIL